LAAGKLVRPGVHDAFGVRQADHGGEFDGSRGGLTPAQPVVQPRRFGQLPPDAHQRVESGERLLEDHGETVAAQLRQGAVGAADQLRAVEPDAAGGLGAVRQQSEHGQRGERLARTGRADQPEPPALGELEAHAVDDRPPADADTEISNLKQCHRSTSAAGSTLRALPRSRGSVASRRPSPSRLKPSTATATAMPGQITSRGLMAM
jgi:hypothetical protein